MVSGYCPEDVAVCGQKDGGKQGIEYHIAVAGAAYQEIVEGWWKGGENDRRGPKK